MALVLGVLFIAIVRPDIFIQKTVVPTSATTSLAALSPEAAAPVPVQTQSLTSPKSSSSSPTVTKPTTVKQVPIPAAVVPAPKAQEVVAVPPALPAVSPQDLALAAATLRGALVNILCYARPGTPFHSISASGVIVTSSGTILTNAHVGQYFLLANKGVSCKVRVGSPAKNAYVAALEYIPRRWLEENQNVLLEASPSGTGERDYALLAITGSATDAPLPSSFPYISLATTPPLPGTSVVIASFGAQFLTTTQVQTSLFPTIVYGSIKAVYTFLSRSVDVLALGGTAAAQEGSSGGGVADASGELVGTITTSTVTGDTASRELNAITASYIRADYASATGEPLDFLLQRSPVTAAAAFAANIPALEALVVPAN